MKKNALTVIIPAYNAELYIDKLLCHLENWADEIIVCDSFSTDSTLEIARSHGVKIIQHEYINSAKQKNWAIPQAANEWVLINDTDEMLEENLKTEIKDFLSSVPEDVDLARIPRKNLFYGKFMGKASGYPDYQTRLFRRDKARYCEREVHAYVQVSGKVVDLKNALVHDDFTDISSWWLRNNRYYRYELDECIKQGKHWTFKKQFLKPAYYFYLWYIRRGGILYGFRGFFWSFTWYIYYFMIAAKLYEYELSQKQTIKHKSANYK